MYLIDDIEKALIREAENALLGKVENALSGKVHLISFHLLAVLNIDGIHLTQGISRLKCFPSCCES